MAPASDAGEFTVELLDLNDPDGVEFRAALIKVIDTHVASIRSAERTVADVRALLAKAETDADKERIGAALLKAERNLAGLNLALTNLVG